LTRSSWQSRRNRLSRVARPTDEGSRPALSVHLLPFFARHRLSQITEQEVDRYKAAKAAEARLSRNSINKTLTRLSQILEVAVEYKLVGHNPARGKRRRLRPDTPRRASMGADQVAALLESASSPTHRAMLATAIKAGGLRVSELTGLRWRDVDLAVSKLRVEASKTQAGVREVEMPPDLCDELKGHKMGLPADPRPDAFVFPGRDGKRRNRNAVRVRVLGAAIKRANEHLAERELPTIDPDVTFHSLRRTYASLCAEASIDAAWTKEQIGHRSARFTLDVYTSVEHRRQSPAARLDALIRGEGPSPMGTGAQTTPAEPEPAKG
jgi:integrase/recombinase XerC